MDSWDAQKMLDKYIHDYLVKKGMHKTAEAFAGEANVINPMNVAIKSPEGLLVEWWDVFYDKFNSNQATRTMDNVVPNISSAVPTSSPHSVKPAHNISPVAATFSPERMQQKCNLVTPEDKVTSKMDRPSQRVPFVRDSRSQHAA